MISLERLSPRFNGQYYAFWRCSHPDCVQKAEGTSIIYGGHIYDLCKRHYEEFVMTVNKSVDAFRFNPD